jgi:threonine dehydratase
MNTEHEGLATRVPFELTNKILWKLLDDFLLVSDDEINQAIRLLARDAKQVAEGAGAASLAGAIKMTGEQNGGPTRGDFDGLVREDLRGKKVVGILTGGNIPPDRLAAVMRA